MKILSAKRTLTFRDDLEQILDKSAFSQIRLIHTAQTSAAPHIESRDQKSET